MRRLLCWQARACAGAVPEPIWQLRLSIQKGSMDEIPSGLSVPHFPQPARRNGSPSVTSKSGFGLFP